ncbi:uncharacterized protein LOC113765260 [Coffea eugenioides]|uniref:uncharacterized protein LOC113765260 n=1 Tax=Coffea eugenioides TaxID=49369 RepID=UPI000F604C22|nr:uncharacterized protein LOC113765260 [Coffea eugenioides]
MSTVAARSATAAIGAGQKNMMGGGLKNSYCVPMASTVNPTDPNVIETAKFAVKKYNERNDTARVFTNVEFGFCWPHGGTFYMLAIITQDVKGTHHDVAYVCDAGTGNGHTYEFMWYNNNNN